MFFLTPFLASLKKEFLLLIRDRAGLLLLFVMPVVLVVVITLVQENVLQKMGGSETKVILVDQDGGTSAQRFRSRLANSASIKIISMDDASSAIARVADGEVQMGIVIRSGMTDKLGDLAARMVEEGSTNLLATASKDSLAKIEVYFDPTVFGGMRAALKSSVESVALTVQFEELWAAMQSSLDNRIAQLGLADLGGGSDVPGDLDLKNLDQQKLIEISESLPANKGKVIIPNSVQQNVPAWALFGIFFIVVPLAATLIKERFAGTLGRLLVMPAPASILLLGKVVVYAVVCFGQFALILVIGKYLLPSLGTPALVIGVHYGAIALVIFASALAASSYGILLGVMANTYDQASMFGSLSVVIAAAIGGVMVPVYAMPEIMQSLSAFSPLNWGLVALLKIFVRDGALVDVIPEVARLLGFAFFATFTAWVLFRRREARGSV